MVYMQMTREQFAARFPDRPEPVPVEYAGEWVAWNEGHTQIVAHGANMSEVRDRAVATGCAQPVLQRVPPGPFVGGA